MIDTLALSELKRIYLKCYGVSISDEQARELGCMLIDLMKVIAKPTED